MHLSGKNISVIGMGKSGLATANFLVKRGAQVLLTDARPERSLLEVTAGLNPTIELQFGNSVPAKNADLIVLSPGVPVDAPFLDEFRERGIEIIGEIELAFRFNKTPIIAITGSNGKSTVTTLVGNILRADGRTVHVGGNLGTPFIELIERETAELIVLEISSFQLETVTTFKPYIAGILNITPDHLDRHKTSANYHAMKERIATQQSESDYFVANLDAPETVKLSCGKRSQKLFFGAQHEGGDGAYLRNGEIIIKFQGREEVICKHQEIAFPLRLLVENALAAIALTAPLNISTNALADALCNFSGLEHRMEWVRTFNGIDFINDSKATNVGATCKSLFAIEKPIVLMLGGRDKQGDFSAMLPLLKQKVRHLVLFGEARGIIRNFLNGSPANEEADSFESALKMAVSLAQAGDTVLLAPACASQDMFKNYEERGSLFKTLVNNL
jgi:UDP-N-acetylmuramoylalanine--D-glutamate ligase